MIGENGQNKQLPNEIKSTFKELNVFKHLRKAGITKSFGFSCAYIFKLIFCLIFENKNWFRMLESKKSSDVPAKDTVYRFLNESTFNWRRFLLSLAAYVITKVSKLTHHSRPKVFVLDDPSYDRNRSKQVELLARCFDHASQKMRFYKGFRMLTLGWSDGATFMLVDFSLLSSKKSQINGISETVDKRTSGYKRRQNALQTAPEQIPNMLKVDFNHDDFDFLGFTFEHWRNRKKDRKPYYIAKPKDFTWKEFCLKIKERTKEHLTFSKEIWVERVNQIIRGKINYFLTIWEAINENRKYGKEFPCFFNVFRNELLAIDGYIRRRLRVAMIHDHPSQKKGHKKTTKWGIEYFTKIGLIPAFQHYYGKQYGYTKELMYNT